MIQGINAHMNAVTKRGCEITTVEPKTKTIEGKIQRGEIVPIHAYSYTGSFRWPMVGERWIIREENGNWYLDSIREEQEPTEGEEKTIFIPEPGDQILSSGSGRVFVNEKGKLREITGSQLIVSGYEEEKLAKDTELSGVSKESGEYAVPARSKARFILAIFGIKGVENSGSIILDKNQIAITERSGSVGAEYKTTLTVVVPPHVQCIIRGEGVREGGGVTLLHLWESV